MQIIWKGSPNKDSNRKTIDRIVIHWFGMGTLESANTRFQNPDQQVSAHYGISNNRIWQWVKNDEVAYHAGNYEMNQRSIGIEHDATVTQNASDATYSTSIKLVAKLCGEYNIPVDREHIIGHREVKATQCPGSLDIDRIIKGVNEIIAKPITQGTIDSSTQVPVLPPEDSLKAIYKGILGTDISDDELKARNEQLSNGTPLHDIVSQVLHDDGRSPLKELKDKNRLLKTSNETLTKKVVELEENIQSLAEQLKQSSTALEALKSADKYVPNTTLGKLFLELSKVFK